ncbi:MAG: hypothetical protein ABFD04_14555 [Syntrophomonas sp.]
MNNTRAWEEYYLEYINGAEKFEQEPVTIEELNQMWIAMRDDTDMRQEALDWVQAILGDDYPETLAMSIEELNEVYVKLYVAEAAEIKAFPIYKTLSAA